VVPDTLEEERFAANPLVTAEPNIRFYAGHPLAGPDGHLMGTLCIIDHRPRQLSAPDLSVLADLASIVENEMANREFAAALAAQRLAEGRLRTILNAAPLGICLVDSDEVIRDCNPAFENLVGSSPGPPSAIGLRSSRTLTISRRAGPCTDRCAMDPRPGPWRNVTSAAMARSSGSS